MQERPSLLMRTEKAPVHVQSRQSHLSSQIHTAMETADGYACAFERLLIRTIVVGPFNVAPTNLMDLATNI